MHKFLDRFSVGKKILIISLFFALALVGVVVYTVATLNQQKADSTVINIAGRQRMLTQKFTKELFDDLGRSRSGQSVRSTDKTKKLFEVSLAALRDGGETFSDLGMKKPLSLPPNQNEEIEAKLAVVANQWSALQVAAEKLRVLEPASPEFEKALARVRDLNIKTLKNMNAAVGMLAAASAGKVSAMMTAEWLILIVVLAIGIWFSLLVSRAITQPLARVVEATGKIANGDLNIEIRQLKIDSRDEVGALANSFTTMVKVLRGLQQELTGMTDAAHAGQLDKRCDTRQFKGAWAGLLDGVNNITEQFSGPLIEASGYLDRISHGDIPEPIETEYRGDFNQIKDSVNRCVAAVNGLLDESGELIASAQRGRLDVRGETGRFEGSWQELIVGLNAIFDAIVEPVKGTRHMLQQLAEGDLSETMSGKFEGEFGMLQENVNSTILQLRETVGPIQEAADLINTASDEIVAGNSNLSARTEGQASSLEQTASSMEELTSTVRSNADSAQQANQLAASARQMAERGGDVVSHAVQAMNDINESSTRIAEIIGVINEIAFQTNLLALNASVEAARAGEQGRGFAVVATEVRNLAGRSATAAKEIKGLIEDSVNKVEAGSSLVNESGETLNEIMVGVKKVGDIIAEIAAASQEQSQGIDQVNQAVTSMDEMTQQNAALAEQTAAAAASMSEKADEMERLIGFFRLQPADESAA